jgi:hypothetical protein
MNAYRWSGGRALLGTIWWWMVKITPQSLEPRERPGTYFAGGWVASRTGLSWRRKISPLPRSDPRTVHTVACHSTDYGVLLISIYLFMHGFLAYPC